MSTMNDRLELNHLSLKQRKGYYNDRNYRIFSMNKECCDPHQRLMSYLLFSHNVPVPAPPIFSVLNCLRRLCTRERGEDQSSFNSLFHEYIRSSNNACISLHLLIEPIALMGHFFYGTFQRKF